MASAFKAFLNSPVGPKTVHFWGPAANWGLVLAAMMDMAKPADQISLKVRTQLSPNNKRRGAGGDAIADRAAERQLLAVTSSRFPPALRR